MTVRVRFGEVVRKVNDKIDPVKSGVERYVAGEHMDTDEPRIHRWGTVGNGYLGPAFHMRFKPGHILYGSRRTYLRKVAMADFAGVCANTTYVLEPSTPHLLPEFLLLVMSTERFHQNSISLSKGSTNPYINFSDIEPFEFELPSHTRQQEVIDSLNVLDVHMNKLKELLIFVERLKRASLRDFFRPDSSKWSGYSLGEVCEIYQPRPLATTELVEDGQFIVFGANGPIGRYSAFNHEEPEVVVTCRGATCGIVRMTPEKCWVTSNAMVVRPSESFLSKSFLYWALQGPVSVWKSISGSAQPQITRESLSSLSIDIPPLSVQEHVVAVMSALALAAQRAEGALDSLKIVRSTLLESEMSR